MRREVYRVTDFEARRIAERAEGQYLKAIRVCIEAQDTQAENVAYTQVYILGTILDKSPDEIEADLNWWRRNSDLDVLLAED
jgi:hypothetical protein